MYKEGDIMSFNQEKYIKDYNNNNYKMYQFRVKKSDTKIIKYLDSLENKNDFEINGSVLLRVLSGDLKINLDSDVNETIGGWVIEQLNRMPVVNDKIEYEGWTFEVKKIQAHRIERMRIYKQAKEVEE